MKLTKKEKNRLFNFLGYGNPKARIWFLGTLHASFARYVLIFANVEQASQLVSLTPLHASVGWNGCAMRCAP